MPVRMHARPSTHMQAMHGMHAMHACLSACVRPPRSYISVSPSRPGAWQSFYPRQILGNVENFSQTLLVTVPQQLLHTHTHTYSTDRHRPKSRHLALHTHTHTNRVPGGTAGKVRDQQKHSRETGEDRRSQMQDSTQQDRKTCTEVEGGSVGRGWCKKRWKSQ